MRLSDEWARRQIGLLDKLQTVKACRCEKRGGERCSLSHRNKFETSLQQKKRKKKEEDQTKTCWLQLSGLQLSKMNT